jgi:hypothetical protein
MKGHSLRKEKKKEKYLRHKSDVQATSTEDYSGMIYIRAVQLEIIEGPTIL